MAIALLFIALQLVKFSCTHSDHHGTHATLSESEHYDKEHHHNVEYDHEAFLGHGHGHDFDKLSDEEAKKRLKKMFVKIDNDEDSFVDKEELFDWIEIQRTRYMWDMLDDVIRDDDKNKDGKLSWKEYKASHFGEWDNEDLMDEILKKRMKKAQHKFEQADANEDGILERHEYIYFRHPEESRKVHMHDVATDEVIDDIDQNGDRLIDLKEFLGQYNDDTNPPDWVIQDRKHFISTLDMDKDGVLNFEEVKAWVIPDRKESVKEAKHLIEGADENGDQKLSADEIVMHFNLFVGSTATDHGKALKSHDEF